MASYANKVDDKIYVYSDAIFGKIHSLVQMAEKHVYLQTWTFMPKTKPALYLADAIRKLHARRVRQNKTGTVHIWLMLNIISLQNRDNERRKVHRYIVDQGLDLQGIEIHVGFFQAKLLGANHAKTVSVDNKVALITGANFSPSNNGKGFFDLGFVVSGEVVKTLDYDFIQTWISFIDSSEQPTEWGSNKTYNQGCTPILLTRSKAFPNFSSKIQHNSMNDAIFQSIKNARKSIDIITPNLNVTRLMDELAKAALRGVRVRIILSKGFTDSVQELPTRGGSNDRSIERLHRGMSQFTDHQNICSFLEIHWYGLDGRTPVDSPDPPASHAKFMIVDDKVVYFGSANMDNQSWVNSREVALFVDKSRLAAGWRKGFFDPVFARSVVIDRCKN